MKVARGSTEFLINVFNDAVLICNQDACAAVCDSTTKLAHHYFSGFVRPDVLLQASVESIKNEAKSSKECGGETCKHCLKRSDAQYVTSCIGRRGKYDAYYQ